MTTHTALIRWTSLALCLHLAGCNGASDPAGTSLEQSIAAPQSSQMVALASGVPSRAPSQPIAALPGDAGSVASVRTHAYVNGFRQDILLKGSALRTVSNSLTILARTSRQATLDETTPLFKPTEAAIRSELGREFPHIAMQVVERSSSNAYGPYGLALGRAEGSIHCLYMWQWIDENRLPPDAGVTGPAAIRVRLCRANTTFDEMASLTDHLSIGRDAAASYVVATNENAGIVSGPTDPDAPKTPRKRAKRVAHHARPAADARRDQSTDDPIFATPKPTLVGATTPAPLATDLPPQAYLGPKGNTPAKPN